LKKCIPLTFEQHEQLAKDLRISQEILEPWLEKLWKAYGVKCKEAAQLHQILNLLSSKIFCSLDERWYKIEVNDQTDPKYTGHSCPYYGKGKKAY
jgi:hypothetical protein